MHTFYKEKVDTLSKIKKLSAVERRKRRGLEVHLQLILTDCTSPRAEALISKDDNKSREPLWNQGINFWTNPLPYFYRGPGVSLGCEDTIPLVCLSLNIWLLLLIQFSSLFSNNLSLADQRRGKKGTFKHHNQSHQLKTQIPPCRKTWKYKSLR